MNRSAISPLLAISLACWAGAPEAAAQAGVAGALVASEAVRELLTHPAGSTTGFGKSASVLVVVVRPGEEVPIGGTFHSTGHRWHGVAPAPTGPRVLGDPVGERGPGSYAAFERGPLVAPAEAGVWTLESGGGERVTVITTVSAGEVRAGRLNGYHIGTYPTQGSGRTDAYSPPAAFIEVTPENRDLRVSEHLVLGQFLTKDQFDVWPKYVALDTRLLDKLELVIQELRAMGVRADRMHVMSGFRTPQYNGPGGDGRATLSRHMWGDAADVWIDNNGDGQMDDLNGDGRVDLDDAAVMMRAVERVERKYPELIGGAGTYPTTAAHGPYIHVDVRGYHSRW